jgi:hypothetical protein
MEIYFPWGGGVHKFSRNLGAPPRFYAPEGQRKASSVLRTHGLGVSCAADFSGAFLPVHVRWHTCLYTWEKTAVIILKVLGATAQNLAAQQARRPGFVHACIPYYQLQRAYEFVTCVIVFPNTMSMLGAWRLTLCIVKDTVLDGVDPSPEYGTVLFSAIVTTL